MNRDDPDSVKFCRKLGLTYVICSPFPLARRPPRRRAGRARGEEGRPTGEEKDHAAGKPCRVWSLAPTRQPRMARIFLLQYI